MQLYLTVDQVGVNRTVKVRVSIAEIKIVVGTPVTDRQVRDRVCREWVDKLLHLVKASDFWSCFQLECKNMKLW